jgi:hypothetical protein
VAGQQVKPKGAELDPFEEVLFAIGRAFLTEEAVVRASRHDLWLFKLSLAVEPVTIWHDMPRCGWHIRLRLPKELT